MVWKWKAAEWRGGRAGNQRGRADTSQVAPRVPERARFGARPGPAGARQLSYTTISASTAAKESWKEAPTHRLGPQQQDDQGGPGEQPQRERVAVDHDRQQRHRGHQERALRRHAGAGEHEVERGRQQGEGGCGFFTG